MNKREKIIVGLVIAVILFLSLDYLINDVVRASPDSPYGAHSSQEIILPAEAHLSAMRFTKADTLILESLRKPWNQHPLQPPPEQEEEYPGETTTPPPTPSHQWRYTGYFKIGSIEIALLNNQEFKEGEKTPDEQYRILEITPEKLILQNLLSQETLSLPKDLP